MTEAFRFIKIEFTEPVGHWFPIYSWLIKKVQGTRYSHVRMSWYGSVDRKKIIYEASGSQVHFKGTLSQKILKANVVKSYSIRLSKDQYRKMIALCMEYAGVSYGSAQAIGIAMVHLFGLKLNPLSQGRSSQVCSELVGRFLVEVLELDLEINLDIAGPLEIDSELKRLMGGSDSIKET